MFKCCLITVWFNWKLIGFTLQVYRICFSDSVISLSCILTLIMDVELGSMGECLQKRCNYTHIHDLGLTYLYLLNAVHTLMFVIGKSVVGTI